MTNLLWHYTINTTDVFNCSQKIYQPEIIRLLRPIVLQAIREGQAESPLPNPLNDHKVKITVADGCALLDVCDRNGILTCNAIAWTEAGQEQCWPLFEALYLKLMGQFETVGISRAPQMPKELPWLATLVLPNPGALVDWLADFEQCFALALIDASQPKRPKPKGFGK